VARDKTGKMEGVAGQIARLILHHGVDAVTHARVARGSGVSRPWLYKYVGRERAELLEFMARHFGLRLAELDQRPSTASRARFIEDTVEGLCTMARLAAAAPWVLPLYYRYVGSEGRLGECVAEIEARYLALSERELVAAKVVEPARARLVAELIHAARLGIVHRHLTRGLPLDGPEAAAAQTFRGWLESL